MPDGAVTGSAVPQKYFDRSARFGLEKTLCMYRGELLIRDGITTIGQPEQLKPRPGDAFYLEKWIQSGSFQ